MGGLRAAIAGVQTITEASYMRIDMRKILVPLLLLNLALAGCASLPSARSVNCAESKRVPIHLSKDGETQSIILDVLTYNVEGLPKRVRSSRPADLRALGDLLASLRSQGMAPDIILFQEVFSGSARRAVLASGYPSLAPGPSATDPQPRFRSPALPGRPRVRRGEVGMTLASSGIVIASEFPIIAQARKPYARGSCAGLDCLSNKGVVFARIEIPGVPLPIDLFTTHMNSGGASRVSERRHLAAHRKQSRELMAFVDAHSDPRTPTVLGGDFNMRGSAERFAEFARDKPLTLVPRYCLGEAGPCDVRIGWNGEEPWMETQDLQLFRSGSQMTIRPVRVEAMFDGEENGPQLSDHDGVRVVYEISWPVDLDSQKRCG